MEYREVRLTYFTMEMGTQQVVWVQPNYYMVSCPVQLPDRGVFYYETPSLTDRSVFYYETPTLKGA